MPGLEPVVEQVRTNGNHGAHHEAGAAQILLVFNPHNSPPRLRCLSLLCTGVETEAQKVK